MITAGYCLLELKFGMTSLPAARKRAPIDASAERVAACHAVFVEYLPILSTS